MSQRTRWAIGWALGLVPAVVLFYAALMKGLDPQLFADQITGHRVTPAAWSPFLATAFVAVELVLALALLLRWRPRLTHALFVALMLGFIAVTALAWAKGAARECGCFGRAAQRGPMHVILEDAALIVVSLASLGLLWKARSPRRADMAIAAAVPLSIVFALLGGRLPADPLVTGLRPGSDLADLPVEDLRTPHTQGNFLLALVGPDCPACDRAVKDLSEVARRQASGDAALRIVAVYAGGRQEAMTWRLRNIPAFPVAHASARALRAYYRDLPTSFLLRDGRLVRAWWGRIPGAEDLARAGFGGGAEPIAKRPEP